MDDGVEGGGVSLACLRDYKCMFDGEMCEKCYQRRELTRSIREALAKKYEEIVMSKVAGGVRAEVREARLEELRALLEYVSEQQMQNHSSPYFDQVVDNVLDDVGDHVEFRIKELEAGM